MGRFGHHLARHDAVLFGHVVEEVPHAAVAHRRLEEKLHVAVGHRPVGRRNGVLEEEIALLEHVPEVVVVVREIELRKAEPLHDRRTQHVHRGEHPAPPGLFLVGDALHLDPVFEIVVDLPLQVAVQGQLPQVRLRRQRILQRRGGAVLHEGGGDLFQVRSGQFLGRSVEEQRSQCQCK